MSVVPRADAAMRQIQFLIDVARILKVSTWASAQYPQRLGDICPSIQGAFDQVSHKRDFSAANCESADGRFLDGEWMDSKRDQIVVTGFETSICVMQSVLDWLSRDRQVFVVVDAVATRNSLDHGIALDRMRCAGAVMVTAEMLAFEWLGTSTHPQFREVSALVKQNMADVAKMHQQNVDE